MKAFRILKKSLATRMVCLLLACVCLSGTLTLSVRADGTDEPLKAVADQYNIVDIYEWHRIVGQADLEAIKGQVLPLTIMWSGRGHLHYCGSNHTGVTFDAGGYMPDPTSDLMSWEDLKELLWQTMKTVDMTEEYQRYGAGYLSMEDFRMVSILKKFGVDISKENRNGDNVTDDTSCGHKYKYIYDSYIEMMYSNAEACFLAGDLDNARRNAADAAVLKALRAAVDKHFAETATFYTLQRQPTEIEVIDEYDGKNNNAIKAKFYWEPGKVMYGDKGMGWADSNGHYGDWWTVYCKDTGDKFGTTLGEMQIFREQAHTDDTGLWWGGDDGNSFGGDHDDPPYDRFYLYWGEKKQFSAITEDYIIGKGQIMNVDDGVILMDGVRLIVEPGGVLSIEGTFYNNGIIENRGTVLLQNNAVVTSFYSAEESAGRIVNDGGKWNASGYYRNLANGQRTLRETTYSDQKKNNYNQTLSQMEYLVNEYYPEQMESLLSEAKKDGILTTMVVDEDGNEEELLQIEYNILQAGDELEALQEDKEETEYALDESVKQYGDQVDGKATAILSKEVDGDGGETSTGIGVLPVAFVTGVAQVYEGNNKPVETPGADKAELSELELAEIREEQLKMIDKIDQLTKEITALQDTLQELKGQFNKDNEKYTAYITTKEEFTTYKQETEAYRLEVEKFLAALAECDAKIERYTEYARSLADKSTSGEGNLLVMDDARLVMGLGKQSTLVIEGGGQAVLCGYVVCPHTVTLNGGTLNIRLNGVLFTRYTVDNLSGLSVLNVNNKHTANVIMDSMNTYVSESEVGLTVSGDWNVDCNGVWKNSVSYSALGGQDNGLTTCGRWFGRGIICWGTEKQTFGNEEE